MAKVSSKQLGGVLRTDVFGDQYISGSIRGNGWSIDSSGGITGSFSGSISGDYVSNTTFTVFSSSVDYRISNITGSAGSGSVGPSGSKGDDGRGIVSITQPSGSFNALVTYTTGSTDTLLLPSGSVGSDGVGILNITQPNGLSSMFVNFTNGTSSSVILPPGPSGSNGRGIVSITQPSGSFNARVTYTTGSTDTLLLPSGSNGTNGRGIVSITQPSGSSTAVITYTTGSSDIITLPTGSAPLDIYRSYNEYFWDTHFSNAWGTGINNSTGDGWFLEGGAALNITQSDVTNPRGPGHMSLGTSTSGSTAGILRGGRGGANYPVLTRSHGAIKIGVVANFTILPDTSQNYVWRFGFVVGVAAGTSDAGSNVAYVEMSLDGTTPRYRLITRNDLGNTNEIINTSISPLTATSTLIELELNPSDCKLLINKEVIATSVTNLPSNSHCRMFIRQVKLAGSSLRVCYHDWYYEYQLNVNPI
jgi:hypothetical protein